MVDSGPVRNLLPPTMTENRKAVRFDRRWIVAFGLAVVLVVAHLTRPSPLSPVPPDLPAPPRAELSAAFSQATDFLDTVGSVVAKPLEPKERDALDALERVLRRRPDLVEFFALQDGLNLTAVLDWSIAENDSDTTLLLPHRTSLRRVRALFEP